MELIETNFKLKLKVCKSRVEINNKLTKELLVYKKIKKNNKYPAYISSSIEDSSINENKMEEIIQTLSNEDFEKNNDKLNTFSNFYLGNKCFYKKSTLWYYLNINYFRQNTLSHKEKRLINYFNTKKIFFRKFKLLKEIINNKEKTIKKNGILKPEFINKLGSYNISVMNYFNILKYLKDNHQSKNLKEIKKFKIMDIINGIISEKELINYKILNKFGNLSKNFNNSNNNIDTEFNSIICNNSINNKSYLMNNYDILSEQVNFFINNYNKNMNKFNYNYSKKLFCIVCIKHFNDFSNYIIYCNICNYGIHLKCYGLPYNRNYDNWTCDSCTAIKKNTGSITHINCFICKSNGGILKEYKVSLIEKKKWIHTGCIYWMCYNLIKVNSDLIITYPFKKFTSIEKCYICKKDEGFKLECKTKNCYKIYHPECHTRMILFIKKINFNIENNIFYNCFNHNFEMILMSRNNNQLILKTLSNFYNKYKDLKKFNYNFNEYDLLETNNKFTLKYMNKQVVQIPNRNLLENINKISENIDEKTILELYFEIIIHDKKFKLLLI